MRLVEFVLLGVLAVIAATAVPGRGEAATPVSSEIDLESSAVLCVGEICETVTDTDQANQTTTLDPLLAEVDAVAFDPALQAGGRASLSVNAIFSSASAGTIGFAGTTGIGQPTTSLGLADCGATNDQSQGFTYIFVASTSGEIDIDYDFSCMPIEFVTAGGGLEIYFDGSFISNPTVSQSSQTAVGTVTRPIVEGQTHTLRIKPNLFGLGGTGCGPPPGWSWSCEGSASWSFDVAEPVPSPSASSWMGGLLLLGAVMGSGGLALRCRA